MKSRGNHSYIDTYDGRPFSNPWSACAADVCPVGALTVKEFRFRARVWHLDDTDSVCPGCSIGCNIRIGHVDDVVYRFLPRENLEVNGWWMCDYGRFLADGLNERDVERPIFRGSEGDQAVPWSEAIARLKQFLGSGRAARVVASANHSNEALYLVRKVFVERMGLEVVVPSDRGEPRMIKNGHREWIHSVDGHPNSTGARLLGLRIVDRDALASFAGEGEGPLLVLDNRAHPWLSSDEATVTLAGRPLAVVARTVTTLLEHARLVLPAASWVETEGTYTSSTGRVQLVRRGIFPKVQARPAWDILFRLAVELEIEAERTTSPRAIFEELAANVEAFRDIGHRRLESEPGVPVLEEVPDVG
jgi:NADH-quinone oxidoreductase subunit G